MIFLIKIIISIVLLFAYTIPLIIYNGDCNCDMTFIDIIYLLGTTIGIGSYLMVDSIPLIKISQCITFSAGIYYIGLTFIFSANIMADLIYQTYWYVVFNTVVTFMLCLYLLYYHRTRLRH